MTVQTANIDRRTRIQGRDRKGNVDYRRHGKELRLSSARGPILSCRGIGMPPFRRGLTRCTGTMGAGEVFLSEDSERPEVIRLDLINVHPSAWSRGVGRDL